MKTRKTPLRKCVATNEMKPKQDLIRIVRNKEGDVFVDPTGKQNGRGAYISLDQSAIDKAEKSQVLTKHLNAEIPASVYTELRELAKGKRNEK